MPTEHPPSHAHPPVRRPAHPHARHARSRAQSDPHSHAHSPRAFDRAFAIGIALNAGFVVIEAIVGWRIDSLALLADAAHNLSDVAGLVLAWGGALAGRLRPDARHTYGWKRASILAAFVNALLLLVAMGALAWEAAHRLTSPTPTNDLIVMAVAAVGIVINALTAMLFFRGRGHDLNIRGAYLHMAADAAVSAGVAVAGLVAGLTGWLWLDPVVSLAIALVIVIGTWSLLRASLHLLFDGVPEGIDLREVRALLGELPGVSRVHDLHVWAMGTTEVALTAHLILPAGVPGGVERTDAFLDDARERIASRFGISHVTLQLLRAPQTAGCCDDDVQAAPAGARAGR